MRELLSKTRSLRFAPHRRLAHFKHDVASLLDPLEDAATDVIGSSKEPATFYFSALAGRVRVIPHAISWSATTRRRRW